MINKVVLIGNLGRDPEVRHFENGSMVAKFSLATNENYRDKAGEWQTNTEWHDIVAWRSLAERAEKTLKKGSLVYVEGKLTHRKYQDKDGNDRYITEVVANTFRLLEKRESLGSNFPQPDDAPGTSYQIAEKSEAPSTTPVVQTQQGDEQAEDDLPF
ncbi:MAG: single-stranded DNA-binding protein [Saprospiraceae bacterium]|nr:single-stranded DNA-binding protein [Saprospiraceae bacterium]